MKNPVVALCMFLLMSFSPASHAGYLIDTGSPLFSQQAALAIGSTPSDGPWRVGASFLLSDEVTIGAIDGFVGTVSASLLTVEMFAGGPDGQLIATGSAVVGRQLDWATFDIADIVVGGGMYTVLFGTADGSMAFMPTPAPFGEVIETGWFSLFDGSLEQWGLVASKEVVPGIRISGAVPEPSSHLLLAAACIGMLATVPRYRRRPKA